MSAENKYRWMCELGTAFSFTCFLILFLTEKNGGFYGAYIGAAITALCGWLANCDGDKAAAQIGIQYNKNQLSSRIFIIISKIRYLLEKICSCILFSLLIIYSITMSYDKEVLSKIAYYEVGTMIWGIMIISYLLLICSVVLVLIQELAMNNNIMKKMLQ